MPLFANPNQYGQHGLPLDEYVISGTDVLVKNLADYLVSEGWDGVTAKDFLITIQAAATVWSNDKTIAAIHVLDADFPATAKITIVNEGLIAGKGDWTPAGGAIYTDRAITIDNQGTISGGGHNSSGSGGATSCANAFWGFDGGSDTYICQGGGCTAGSGSTGYGYSYATAGGAPTTGAAGASCGSPECCVAAGGAGGVGGNAGDDGYCVSGDTYVTWTNTGTRNGSVS